MKTVDSSFPIAVHPGEVLQELLIEYELSQSGLAKHLRIAPSHINEICKGRRGISTEMAVMFAKTFGISASTWINLQKSWELSQIDHSLFENIKLITLRA